MFHLSPFIGEEYKLCSCFHPLGSLISKYSPYCPIKKAEDL